jgi:hypothetical protein
VPPPETPPAAAAPPEGNDAAGSWLSQLSQEAREKYKGALEGLKGKKLSEVMEDYFSAKGALNRAIVLPGGNAGAEEIKAFLQKMDIPETPEGYGLKGELLAAGEDAAALAKEIAGRFASLGLTRKQGAGVYAELTALVKSGQAAAAESRKEMEDGFEARLEEEAGTPRKAKEDLAAYKRFLVSLKNKALVKDIIDSGIAYNPRFVRAMAAYYRETSAEPPFIPGQAGGPGEAKAGMFTYSDEMKKRYGRENYGNV